MIAQGTVMLLIITEKFNCVQFCGRKLSACIHFGNIFHMKDGNN